jgi:hypothetical protein
MEGKQMSQHTPGTWEVGEEDSFQRIAFIEILADDGRTTVAHVQCSAENTTFEKLTDEDRANARLIAAAPDLLAAAQSALAGLNARIDAAPKDKVPVFAGIAALQDAISKATSPA